MAKRKDSDGRLLNPFAFPAETEVYFKMLIAAVFLIVWNIGSVVTLGFDSYNNVFFSTLQDTGAKQSELLGERRFLELTHVELAELGDEISNYSTKILLTHLPRWLIPFEMVAGMLLLIIFLYRQHPKTIRRKFKLQKIPEVEKNGPIYGPVLERLEGLCEFFKIHQIPEVEIENTYGVPDAQVFGFPDSYILRLKNARLFRMQKFKYKLSPLIMHELGHIKNNDVKLYYYTEAAWSALKCVLSITVFEAAWSALKRVVSIKAFVSCLIIIFIILSIKINLSIKIFLLILQIAAMLIAVWLMKAKMLTTREHYADWRVAWYGKRESFIKILEESENNSSDKERWKIKGLFKDWIENIYHPTGKRRLEILQNPIELFRSSSQKIPFLNIPFSNLPFLTGILLGIILVNMSYLIIFSGFIFTLLSELTLWKVVHQLIDHSLPLNHPLFLSIFSLFRVLPGLLLMGIFLIGGFLLAGTVGIQTQREVVADLLDGSRNLSWIRAFWAAIWLTIGLESALWFTPLSPYIPKNSISFLYTLIWMGAHTFLIFGWLIYVQTLNRIAFRTSTGKERPGLTSLKWRLIVAMFAWILYLPMLYARFMIQSSHLLPVISQHLPETINMEFLFIAPLLILSFITFFFSSIFGSILLAGVYMLTGHRPPRCPHCNKITRYKTVLGKKCEHCQEELTPWLYKKSN